MDDTLALTAGEQTDEVGVVVESRKPDNASIAYPVTVPNVDPIDDDIKLKLPVE